MKRLIATLLAINIIAALCSCGTGRQPAAADTPVPTATAVVQTPEVTEPPATPTPTAPPAPAELELPLTSEGWADSYLAFLDDNYDILAALWPEGLTGVGFIDLDLDGTPELVLFDQGVSATLGAHIFDLAEGQVYCISSVHENARGAFDDTYFSPVSVCTSFFEAFRLSRTEEDYCFWVKSANGTTETAWDELVRFGCEDGILTLSSVCAEQLETESETGVVLRDSYYVGGEEADGDAYAAAAAYYTDARDTGYDAKGVFLWNDNRYDVTYEGLMTMARDAVKAYAPIEVS